MLVIVKTDQDGTLYCDFSVDGSNWDSSLSFFVAANSNEIHKLIKGSRYFRTRFTNTSSSGQTYFRMHVSYGDFFVLTSPLNSTINADADAIITRSINEEVAVAEGKYADRFIINKFGRNSDLSTAADVWDGGGDYTGFPSSAQTLTIVSSSSSEGVTTVNSYKRVYRASILTSGSGTTNTGTLTIKQSSATTNIFSVIPIGAGQTQISCYTIPAGYTGYLKRYNASLNDSNANRAEMVIKTYSSNGTQRYLRPFVLTDTSPISRDVYGGVVFAEKTDFIFRVTSIANAHADMTVTWDMMVVKN
jgi:hypothetical protein